MPAAAGGVPPGGHCRYPFIFQPAELGRFTEYRMAVTSGGGFAVRVQDGELRPLFLPLVVK